MNDRPSIVVGIDASWRDSGALDWALRESHLGNRPILAVHVVDEKLPFGPPSPGPESTRPRSISSRTSTTTWPVMTRAPATAPKY